MRPNISDRNIERMKRYAAEKMEVTRGSGSWSATFQENRGYRRAYGVTVDDVLDQLLSEAGF